MPITGSQKALMYCQSGVERCGATRTGYCNGRPFIAIGGTQRGSNVFHDSLTITEALDEVPNTCQMTVDGFTPTKGQEVLITLGSQSRPDKLFAGRILNVEAVYLGHKPANQAWNIHATDYTLLLNQRMVTKRYTSQSATAILLDLVTSYTSGFSTNAVQSGLATIDEIQFTFEAVADCITRVMRRIGGYWYPDYDRVIHAWVGTESNVQNPSDLTSTHPTLQAFSAFDDLSQIVTRAVVEGMGSTVVGGVASSATRIPVESAAMFSASGGSAVTDTQRLTYTGTAVGGGVSVVGYAEAPTDGPIAVTSASSAQLTASSYYCWALTFVTSSGETIAGPRSPAYLSDTIQKSADLSGLSVGDASVTTRKAYRTAGQASAAAAQTATLKFETNLPNLTATAFTGFGILDSSLGAAAPSIAIGQTTLPVRDTAQFSGSGGSVLVAGMTLTYTGRSLASGPGDLTGIPASGLGAITAAVPSGEAVTNLSVLTGVSGLTADLQAGDAIQLLAQVDDAAAQTAYAALVGGDGIKEVGGYIQDRRLSLTEATARATALLALNSAAEVSIDAVTRDVVTKVGRTVTVTSLLGISGVFKAQQVQIDQFSADGRYQPTYHIRGSSRRFTFEDILRTINQPDTVR